MRIHRIGVLSLAKISAVLYGGIGILVGLAVAVFTLLGGVIAQNQQGAGARAPVAGVVAAIAIAVFAPLFYGLMGFIGGIISAALFNLAAGLTGGLEIEIAQLAGEQYRSQ